MIIGSRLLDRFSRPDLPAPDEARAAFIRFIERLIGARAVVPAVTDETEVDDLLLLAARFQTAGLLKGFPQRSADVPDEPPTVRWGVAYRSHESAGGLSAGSEYDALIAAIAEGVERSIWADETDYFRGTRTGTVYQVRDAISPERFAGFSASQRRTLPDHLLAPEDRFVWIRGYSWTQRKNVAVPAQAVSRRHFLAARQGDTREPIIRSCITTGLATGPTREFALLGGALEIFERDAFMIMWMNQLSLPRIAETQVADRNPRIRKLLESCARYRLDVSFVRMITDAPTYAIAAVIRDPAEKPPVVIGTSAHQDFGRAAEKALLEALRARINIRHRATRHPELLTKDPKKLMHTERGVYWSSPERKEHLTFLDAGPVQELPDAPWDHDTDAAHFRRIAAWCAEAGYELASVSLTPSKRNISPWHIEFVLIPELQPMHLDEPVPYLGGARLADVPRRFGYEPLPQPFTDHPHPFI